MKTFVIALLIILVGSVVMITLITPDSTPLPVPFSRLEFEIEPSREYIGSYKIERVNLNKKWMEWGEWKPIEAIFGREVVCFGYFDRNNGHGTFWARSDYHWVQTMYQGRMCLELKKK